MLTFFLLFHFLSPLFSMATFNRFLMAVPSSRLFRSCHSHLTIRSAFRTLFIKRSRERMLSKFIIRRRKLIGIRSPFTEDRRRALKNL
jgi:hypothetical protein